MAKRAKLIISTGDISDVDGFYALAEYFKTGADVVFIMNYPGYIGVDESDVDAEYDSANPGLGYKYSAKQIFARESDPVPEGYKELLGHYSELSSNDRMKAAMTDIAFTMAKFVWAEEKPADRGQLFFCIGGINAINPFSESAIKNEILVYHELVSNPENKLDATEGKIYDSDANPCSLRWEKYDDIYIDFNGSMAFLTDDWIQKLSDPTIVAKIRGAFVMGGVYSDAPPLTMPALPNVLNRFSSATMNQLYHPPRTAAFFEFVGKHAIPTFTITNNVVADLTTFDDAEKKVKTLDGVHKFLSANHLNGPFLRKLAECYYTSKYNPPRKAYDYYTAVVLRAKLTAVEQPHADARDAQVDTLSCTRRQLFYSASHGITFVSESDSWGKTLSAYVAAIDTEPRADDAPFVKTKKDNFRREIEAMRAMPDLPSLPVYDAKFETDSEGRLHIQGALPPAPSPDRSAKRGREEADGAKGDGASRDAHTTPGGAADGEVAKRMRVDAGDSAAVGDGKATCK